jgi:glycine/D-amino acid oxidase-like deaminating enzyme
VTIVEKDAIGYEASGRNMGAIGILGKHAAELAAASVEKWDRLDHEMNHSIDYSKRGRLCPAHTREDLPALDDMMQTGRATGLPLEMLSGDEVRSRFPTLADNVISAIYSPTDAQVTPRKVMEGYRNLARERAVNVWENCLATGLDIEGGRVKGVLTERGYLRADATMVAAGIWSVRFLDRIDIRVPVQFVTSYIGETNPQKKVLEFFLRGPNYCARQLPSGAVQVAGGYRDLGAGHYLSLYDLRNLRLWFPRFLEKRKEVHLTISSRFAWFDALNAAGRGPVALKTFEPRVPLANLKRKLQRVQKVIPAFRDASFMTAWGGVIDLTPDALPILGPVENVRDLYVALGFTGQGFGLGPVVGQLMADLISSTRPSLPLEQYRLSRFSDHTLPRPRRLV